MSQLDPFFMLDAPDLSAGGPSQGYEVGPNQRIEVEEEAESGYQLIHQAAPASSSPPEPTYAPPSPQPTYGAFPLYSGPAEAPQIVTASPTTTTKPPVTKKLFVCIGIFTHITSLRCFSKITTIRLQRQESDWCEGTVVETGATLSCKL